jgi:hypothetical protein
MYLDCFGIQFQAVLVDEKFLNILSLISLELNHLAHLGIDDDGSIAGFCVLATMTTDCSTI